MSTEKLSELSKPVAWPNGCNETSVKALRYLAEHKRPIGGSDMYNTEHLYMIARELEIMSSQHLYSQEYVSALKHESAVNWEAAASLNVENQELKKRIAELEAKLATPVRLPRPACVYADHSYPAYSRKQVEEIITSAGMRFTVEGDE